MRHLGADPSVPATTNVTTQCKGESCFNTGALTFLLGGAIGLFVGANIGSIVGAAYTDYHHRTRR
jgi:hypothetical protein